MTLSDVCVKISDCPHSTATDEGKGHPLLRTPNIGKGTLLLDGVHRVSDAVYEQRVSRAVPEKGDLVLAREAPAGNVAIIDTDEKVCLGQRTVLLKVDRQKADPRYLAYYLLSPKMQYELLGTANGATVAHVNMSTIARIPVVLPSLDEQKKVAQMIGAYDNLICNTLNRIKLLEEFGMLLFKNMLSEENDRKKVTDLGCFNRGKTITAKDLHAGEIPVIAGGLEPAYYHDKANTAAPVITVSASGANAGYVNMYYSPVWASDCSWLDINGTKNLFYIYFYLKMNPQILNNLQRGSAQPHVNAKQLNDIEIPIVSQKQMEEFNSTVSPLFIQIGKLKKQHTLLESSKMLLMSKIFTELTKTE